MMTFAQSVIGKLGSTVCGPHVHFPTPGTINRSSTHSRYLLLGAHWRVYYCVYVCVCVCLCTHTCVCNGYTPTTYASRSLNPLLPARLFTIDWGTLTCLLSCVCVCNHNYYIPPCLVSTHVLPARLFTLNIYWLGISIEREREREE